MAGVEYGVRRSARSGRTSGCVSSNVIPVSTCALGCCVKIIQYMWILGGTSSRLPRGYDEIVSQVGGGEASDFAVDQEVQMTIGTDLAGGLRAR